MEPTKVSLNEVHDMLMNRHFVDKDGQDLHEIVIEEEGHLALQKDINDLLIRMNDLDCQFHDMFDDIYCFE